MEAALQVGFIALFLVLGRVWSRSGAARLADRETLINVATGAFLFALRILVFAGPLAWAARSGGGRLVDLSALTHPAAQLAVALLITDFCRYWLHRAHHRIPVLWSFHRVHHSSRRLDATSGLRMHLVDFIQLSALPVLLFGLLFDASSWPRGIWVALGAIVGAMDAFQHADLKMDTRQPILRLWDRLLNNPHFHSWHHTREVDRFGDGNYGQALTVWDRLFGTCVSQPEACRELGLADDQDSDPSPWGLQLLRPRASGAAASGGGIQPEGEVASGGA